MPDEFPALEVALGAAVLALGIRIRSLALRLRDLEPELIRVRSALRRGTGADPDPSSPLRSLVMAAKGRAADGPRAVRRAVRERGRSLARRERSHAARELLICGVLVASLLYAHRADLPVSPEFFALGALATLLLLTSATLRSRFGRAIQDASRKLARTATRSARHQPDSRGR